MPVPEIQLEDDVPEGCTVQIEVNHREMVLIMESLRLAIAGAGGNLIEMVESSMATKMILHKFFPVDHFDHDEGSSESSKLAALTERLCNAHDLLHKQGNIKTGKEMPS